MNQNKMAYMFSFLFYRYVWLVFIAFADRSPFYQGQEGSRFSILAQKKVLERLMEYLTALAMILIL